MAKKMKCDPKRKGSQKYCRFLKDNGHDTEDCFQLKDEVERPIKQGFLHEFIDQVRAAEALGNHNGRRQDRRSRSRSQEKKGYRNHGGYQNPPRQDKQRRNEAQPNLPLNGVIYTIAGGPACGDSKNARRRHVRKAKSHEQRGWSLNIMIASQPNKLISVDDRDYEGVIRPQNDPMVITMTVANFSVQKILVDNGSSADILFWHVLEKVNLDMMRLCPMNTPLVGFGGSEVIPLGTINLPASLGSDIRKTVMIKFLVVDAPFAYNEILGRPRLNLFSAIVSTSHLKMKFMTKDGVGVVRCDQNITRECYTTSLRKKRSERGPKKGERMQIAETYEVESEAGKRPRLEGSRVEPFKHKMIELYPGNP